MTDSFQRNQDWLGSDCEPELVAVAGRLGQALGQRAKMHEAPEEIRTAIMAAIRATPQPTTQSTVLRSVKPRRRTFSLMTSGGLALAAAVAIVAVIVSSLVATPATSADSVFRQAASAGLKPGQAAYLRYLVKISGSQLSVPQTGSAAVQVLAATAAEPEVAREDLSVIPTNRGQTWCIALHTVVVGDWEYTLPGANCGMGVPMVLYSLFMSGQGPCLCGLNPFPDGALTANALYGASVARQLLHHPSAGAVLRRGRFDGRSAFIITVAHWPDQPLMKRVTLDFDAHSYVLLGIKATANSLRYQFNLIASHIGSSKPLPASTFRLVPSTNSLLMSVPVSASRANLLRVCPGIHDLKHLLDANYGPLRSCKTAIPAMTARRLAHLFTGPVVPRAVWQAERAGVFTAAYARKSLAASLAYMTKWVTWGHSLRYNSSTVR